SGSRPVGCQRLAELAVVIRLPFPTKVHVAPGIPDDAVPGALDDRRAALLELLVRHVTELTLVTQREQRAIEHLLELVHPVEVDQVDQVLVDQLLDHALDLHRSGIGGELTGHDATPLEAAGAACCCEVAAWRACLISASRSCCCRFGFSSSAASILSRPWPILVPS